MATRDVSTHALSDLIEALSRFSAPGTGVTRLAYDEAWCEAHHWLERRAEDLGLAATSDGAGNLFFHPRGVRPGELERPVILIGSHLDSVRHGGAFDGAYGVLAGLLVAHELRKQEALPVVAFATAEEEESRFRPGLLGARALLGQVRQEDLDATRDEMGVSWREALLVARDRECCTGPLDLERPFPPLFRPAIMLEPHIEQGPVLEAERLVLGLVERIAGYRRMRALVVGEARHSGTTPMGMRRDALAAAAEMVLAVEALGTRSHPLGVATTGAAHALPGLHNVVPGSCELGFEVRHASRQELLEMAAEVGRICHRFAERRGVEVHLEEVSRQDPVALSPSLVEAAEHLARELRLPHRRMTSGAAHDAMVFARAGIPSLMVFVPSSRGVSHAPEEHSDAGGLVTGLRFTTELARWLSSARAWE